MSPIWMVPVLVLALGGIAVAVAVRHLAESARELTREVDRLGEIAVAAAVVWDEARRARTSVRGPLHR